MDIDTAPSVTVLTLPTDGPSTAAGRTASGAEQTVPVPGWGVLDSMVERFAPEAAIALAADFAGTVSAWSTAPSRVVYTVAGGRDVLVGLSYQTAPTEILAAVWTGLSVAIARTLRDNMFEGAIVVDSDHPGADALVERLADLGIPVAGGSRAPEESSEVGTEIDDVVRVVALTARESVR
ncbi:hypothetical protein [Gordonia soli]|uniref:Uncharacterized protein n=1 Tax=Gordonia soli NBRC 108243 TaxID=1223545 RepID=M0QIF0_9ACTN|nr:hypothetical protein [Gordonia soli]GAC68370.1 hypothetical protein GS4_15_00190 [Gordonia soli NBRC 108243]